MEAIEPTGHAGRLGFIQVGLSRGRDVTKSSSWFSDFGAGWVMD